MRHLLLVSRKLNGNFDQLKQIIETGQTVSVIRPGFPLEKIQVPENFLSLLYFFGLLTIDQPWRNQYQLRIPNESVKHLMYGYLRDAYWDVETFRIDIHRLEILVSDMGWAGEWEGFFDTLAQAVKQQTRVRDYMQGEKVLQGFLLAYLHVCDVFHVTSEAELNKGFADLMLEPFVMKYPDMGYGYLIELKYFKRDELTETKLKTTIEAAQTQLRQYLADERLKHYLPHIRFIGLVLVYHGWELVYRGAVETLQTSNMNAITRF
ncbi:MAG: PD-(D/E)XK nuclease domain-containing protein [SAR324 cluster bacterium]|nr:PD-(D/E)XK nuclease domain-containing protein [SAR324 cluster bacterium]